MGLQMPAKLAMALPTIYRYTMEKTFTYRTNMKRSKVLSLICTSTPRAELHDALELIEFSHNVLREYHLRFHWIIFWTDSQTVLGYLKNRNMFACF